MNLNLNTKQTRALQWATDNRNRETGEALNPEGYLLAVIDDHVSQMRRQRTNRINDRLRKADDAALARIESELEG